MANSVANVELNDTSYRNESFIYYNAGYVNTEIDKNNEDDVYLQMRKQIKNMSVNKCFGQGKFFKIINQTS